MIGTLLWRLREAKDVLLGKKKTVSEKNNDRKDALSTANLPEYKIENQELKSLLDSITIEFFFCEFGEERVNAGGSEFDKKIGWSHHFLPSDSFSQMQNLQFTVILT